jgi:tetratricopeptide (TPR) repeat protein
MEHYNESIDIYLKIISLSHDSKYAEFSSYKLATYYYALGDYKNAHRYVDVTLTNKIILKDEDSYLLKGYIYYDVREYYRALKIFDDFPKRFPQSQMTQSAKEWKAMCERSIKYLS